MSNRNSTSRETLLRSRVAKRSTCVFIVFSAVMGFYVLVLGQMKHNRKLSRLQLPEQSCSRLIERFNQFVAYERTQSYAEQFDLLAKMHIAHLLHMDVTKENYVKFKQETEKSVGKLIELKVKDIKGLPDNSGSLNLSVIAKLRKGKSIYFDKPICVAYLVNGDWYFSLLYIN